MKKIFLTAIVFLLTGCVSFTSDNTNKPMDYTDIQMPFKPSIKLEVYTFPTNNGTPVSEKQVELNQKFYSQLKHVFDNTKMFGEVGKNVKNPDYKLDVVIKNTYTECYWCNVHNVISLSIAPSWTNSKFYYEATLSDAKTGKAHKLEYFEKSKEVREFFMLFAMPFMYDAEDKMHERVFSDIVYETGREISK